MPIPKNGDTTNQTNYRPICLLSILSKHLERHIVNLLLQHLLETRPIFWFTVELPELKIYSHSPLGKYTQLVWTCLKKVKRLELCLGKHLTQFPYWKSWMTCKLTIYLDHSYLSERKQQVVVNGSSSDALPVLSGVPQGLVIEPLLFLITLMGLNPLPYIQTAI